MLGQFSALSNKLVEKSFPFQCIAAIENPQSVDEYLHDFVSEMQKLEMPGVSDNSAEFYSIELVAVICDAPTGSCIKFIKGHSRYNCCERCI